MTAGDAQYRPSAAVRDAPESAPASLYVVVTRVPRRSVVAVGSLGAVTFERAWYAYVGSARRGRDARVTRHLRADKALRWHADYLFSRFPPDKAWLVDGGLSECDLAAALAAPADAIRLPVRFGAGDCRCRGHLVRLGRRPRRLDLRLAAGDGAAVRAFRLRRPV